MHGRLRLDKLVQCIEAFVASAEEARQQEKTESDRDSVEAADEGASPPKSPITLTNSPITEPTGPIYVFPPTQRLGVCPKEIRDEIESAVPLTHVLESAGSIPALRRENSMPSPIRPGLSSPGRPLSRRSLRNGQHVSRSDALALAKRPEYWLCQLWRSNKLTTKTSTRQSRSDEL